MISALQIGFGPLGIQIAKYIAQKETVKTVGVVDINPSFAGKKTSDISSEISNEVGIYPSVKEAINQLQEKPDIAIITTVSSLDKLIPQVEEVALFGVPVVSTCEELSYPWILQPELSKQLDTICKTNNIACLGTGVNPGFLMDYLPSVLTSISKEVNHVLVERIQDATPRRVPFQKKIGAGLTIEAFRKKEATGTLRHVGLKESVYLLANAIGVVLDEVTESLDPVIATDNVASKHVQVKKGEARGVEQIAHGYVNGECKIKMPGRGWRGRSVSCV